MAIDLPQSLSEEWSPIGTDTDEMEFGVASVTVETTLYTHESTMVERADLVSETGFDPEPDSNLEHAPDTNGRDESHDEPVGDIPVRSLFTIDLFSNPSLSAVGLTPSAVLGTAAEKATDLFVGRLEDDGITVTTTDDRSASEFDRGDGTIGRWYTLAASYPIETGKRDSNSDTTPQINAETHLAIWPTDDAYRMAGGTVPVSISENAPTEISDALEIEPGRDREAIVELVRTGGLEEGEAESATDGESVDEPQAESGIDRNENA